MDQEDLTAKLKQYHADGVRYGFGMALAIVNGYVEAWNDPRLHAAVPPGEGAARRDQLERVLESLLECEKNLLQGATHAEEIPQETTATGADG